MTKKCGLRISLKKMRLVEIIVLLLALLCFSRAQDQTDNEQRRPRVTILSPAADAVLETRDFHLSYHVTLRPASYCSAIFVNGMHQQIHTAGLSQKEFCQDDVSLALYFQPGDYRIRVVLLDDRKNEVSEESLQFTVQVPAWAQHVVFHGTFDTLETVMATIQRQQSGGYIRFGDDIVLAEGKQDQMQHVDAALQKELQHVLASSGPGVLKTLMINADIFNGIEFDMVPGNHAVDDGFALRMVSIAAEFWQPLPITDVYSNAALSHAATSFPELAVEFLHFLRSSKPVAFVGNNNTSPKLLHYLFGPQCQFIKAPPKNAYAALGNILKELFDALSAANVPIPEAPNPHQTGTAFKQSTADEHSCEPGDNREDKHGRGDKRELCREGEKGKFGVVVLALGPAGKALQLRLLPLARVFSVDFGSLLDALQGWSTRGGLAGEEPPAWIRIGGFDREGFLRLFCSNLEVAEPGEAVGCLEALL